MDRYRGVVTSDKYSVYKRSGPGGRHQLCWAHELRQLRYAAQKKNAPLSAWVLYLQVLDVYRTAPDADRPGHHCARLRRESRSEMRCLLFRYRDAGGTPLEKHVRRLATSLPHLFIFLEYPGVDPTNNAAERVLRQEKLQRSLQERRCELPR